jgi:hypothetical protein
MRLAIVNENGITVDTIAPPEPNPLKAQKQLVRFLHEFTPALSTFRGSVVLTAGGNRFVVVALVQYRGSLPPSRSSAGTNHEDSKSIRSAGAASPAAARPAEVMVPKRLT